MSSDDGSATELMKPDLQVFESLKSFDRANVQMEALIITGLSSSSMIATKPGSETNTRTSLDRHLSPCIWLEKALAGMKTRVYSAVDPAGWLHECSWASLNVGTREKTKSTWEKKH